MSRIAQAIAFARPALVPVAVLAFFLIGVADGPLWSTNFGSWLVLFGIASLGLGGAMALHASNRRGLAFLALAVTAAPGLLAGLVFVLLLIASPRWN